MTFYKLSDFHPTEPVPGVPQLCMFLQLPAEIRLQIYAYLLPPATLVLPLRHHQSSGRDLYGRSWDEVKASLAGDCVHYVSSKQRLTDFAFVRTSRKVYLEAASLLYTECTFNVTVRWDGAHVLSSSIEHGHPAHFRSWPTSMAGFMRKIHVDLPIISKRTFDRRGFMFEAYTDIRRNLRLLIDHLQTVDLQELTVDCFYLACWAEEDQLPNDRLTRGVQETMHAFRSLRGLRKVHLRLWVLDSHQKVLYNVSTVDDGSVLSNLHEWFVEMRKEMMSSSHPLPKQLTAEWTTLDALVALPVQTLDEDHALERLSRKLTPVESDQSRRALQWTMDQAWSAADLGDRAEFTKARRWVYATLARLQEDLNQDLNDHQRRIEEDRKRINECFEGVISDLSDTLLEE